MSQKYTIVPEGFTAAHLASSSFSKKRHYSVTRKECESLLSKGVVAWIDAKDRVLCWKKRITEHSTLRVHGFGPEERGAGRLLRSLPRMVRDVMASEMARRPAEERWEAI